MFEFGDVLLDRDGHELRKAGVLLKVEPQVLDVLGYLIEHRERLVSKNELLDAVWGHRFVTESALTSRIKTARQLIGDTGREQRVIRTVHGKGYRFVAAVSERSAASLPAASPPDGRPMSTAAEILERLRRGRGAALRTDVPGAGSALLRELAQLAIRQGVAIGRGSAHRSSLRSYGCLIEAVGELVDRRPDVWHSLPASYRDEIDAVLNGQVPSRRQRWVLAVHELVIETARAAGGLVLVLEGLQHADADTVAAIEHLGDLTVHHDIVVAVSADAATGGLRRFERLVPAADDRVAADGRAADDPAEPEPPVELPEDVTRALQQIALLEPPFDLHTLSSALAAPDEQSLRLLEICDRLGAVRFGGGRYSVDLDRLGLAPRAGDFRTVADHRLLADRLLAAGGDPPRVAYHLLEGGEPRRAVPYVITTAAARIAAGLHREGLRWIDRVFSEASGAELAELHGLRADALGALGDPAAIAAYRQAITFADPRQVPLLRARLARALLWSGDIEAASELLRGVEPHDRAEAGVIFMVQGMLAYFHGDLEGADALAIEASELALTPGASASLLDAITLQGMIAHSRGSWSDRLVRELRNSQNMRQIASTVFDCHLCVAEYLLYGPTPYPEVIELAERLQQQAEQLDAPRGVAFALCVAGEAKLLSGQLDEARDLLERSVELHRDLGADTGLAHSLQRLAEVQLASGERLAAERTARDALLRARFSPISHHLLQRIYGTLVYAAADPVTALAVVDEAAQVRDEADNCHFCEVMFAVPAAIACAEGGRFGEAEHYLRAAEQCALLWPGTSWQGAVAEARASLCRARGDTAQADELSRQAARSFEKAGQPIDAERCLDAVSISEPPSS